MTQHAEPSYIAEAFQVGISGYVLKRNLLSDLLPAVRQVMGGLSYLSPALECGRP